MCQCEAPGPVLETLSAAATGFLTATPSPASARGA